MEIILVGGQYRGSAETVVDMCHEQGHIFGSSYAGNTTWGFQR